MEDIAVWFVWFPFRTCVESLPYPLVALLGEAGGWFFGLLSGRKGRLMRKELSFLFSRLDSGNRPPVGKMVRRGLRLFSVRQMENLYWQRLTPDVMRRMVKIEGLRYLDAALLQGKGVILVTAHFGSHLLSPLVLGFRGYRVNQAAGSPLTDRQRPIYRRIFRYRKKASERLPLRFIVLEGSLRPVFRALSRNEILFIAFDGREGNTWVTADFFGHRMRFAPGAMKLACHTKAPVLPVFIMREGIGRHRLVIEKPFEFVAGRDQQEAVATGTTAFAAKLAGYVAARPCHYAMTLMRVRELVLEGALRFGMFEEEAGDDVRFTAGTPASGHPRTDIHEKRNHQYSAAED